jgi:hypothetical protein
VTAVVPSDSGVGSPEAPGPQAQEGKVDSAAPAHDQHKNDRRHPRRVLAVAGLALAGLALAGGGAYGLYRWRSADPYS